MTIMHALGLNLIRRRSSCLWGKGLSQNVTPREHKLSAELKFWEGWIEVNGSDPETEYYRRFMMDMGDIKDEAFFKDRVCLDIGCGPMGSLTWVKNARLRIGLDPLASAYMKFDIKSHDMVYVTAAAEKIPFASHSVGVVFSMNSLDHVDSPISACSEIRRVLEPGGFFIGSINLYEAPTVTEPWILTEEFLNKHLFSGWERHFYTIRPKVNNRTHFGPYRYFYEECPRELLETPGPQALWCCFKVQ